MSFRRLMLITATGLLGLFACAPAKVEIVPDRLQRQKDNAIAAFNSGVELLRGRRADYFKAVEKLTEAVRLNPRLYEAQFDLGLLYARGNDLAGSQAAYRAALTVRPGDRAASFNLADVYRKNKKYDQAIKILDKFVAENPKDFEARNNLSVLLRLKGDYDKAMQQARYVLERDPGQVLAYNNMATIFSEKGEH
jgi:tetratricopeptide (TPR) repeat protein